MRLLRVRSFYLSALVICLTVWRIQAEKSSSLGKVFQKSVSLTGKALGGAARQSGKLTYHLIKPKHIEEEELFGMWRIDQFVEGRGEAIANVEVARGRVHVPKSSNDENESETETSYLTSPYRFRPAKNIQSARLDFVAKAYDGEVPYRYKGYLERKLADRSVIKCKGKIYHLGKGWRGQRVETSVGTFVMRRRITLDDDESSWEDDYDFESDLDGDDTQSLEARETKISDRVDFDSFSDEGDDQYSDVYE